MSARSQNVLPWGRSGLLVAIESVAAKTLTEAPGPEFTPASSMREGVLHENTSDVSSTTGLPITLRVLSPHAGPIRVPTLPAMVTTPVPFSQ